MEEVRRTDAHIIFHSKETSVHRQPGARGRGRLTAVLAVALATLLSPAQAAAQDLSTAIAAADGYVNETKPATSYGTAKSLRADGAPRLRSYLRFDVSGTSGTVAKATLHVYAQTAAPAGIEAAGVANTTWTEKGLTWSTAPPIGAKVSASGAIAGAGWIDLDVTSLVRGDGPVAFALTTSGTRQLSVGSREVAASAAQLWVQSAATAPSSDGTAPGVPSGLMASADDGSVTLDWADGVEADLAGYRVYRRAADGTWPAAPTASVTASTWSDGGRANGTEYAYRVTAVDAAGNESAPSGIVAATPTAPAADVQPTFPIRAAFYYPWFPEAWNQAGMYPYTKYHPSLGLYDGSSVSVIQSQVRAMTYGGIEAGIASWWGQGSRTDARIGTLLTATRELGSPFRWALYYENESKGDPSATQIAADLAYIQEKYAQDPAYLRVNGRPVIFVYADSLDACGMADRWKAGNTINAYVVLKVFQGYTACAGQPSSWHQYAPAVAADRQAGYSYAISPAFDKADELSPRLARDLTRFRQNVRDMVASATPWQLVTTFNEWGEGTSVESAQEWASPTGYGDFLDALHFNGDTGTGTVDTTPPAAPNGLTAIGGDGTVALDWADNAEPDLRSYRVYRRASDGSWPAAPTATVSASAHTDSGRTNGTTYDYRVTAVDGSGNESAPSAPASATAKAPPANTAGDPVIAAAGDIACDPTDGNFNGGQGTVGNCRQKATSEVMLGGSSLAAVLTLGDNQYESGTLAAFQGSFDPSWGRLKDIMRPAVGNHEYVTAGAAGYFDYFNGVGQSLGRAGDRSKGYYSYDVGAWHLIAINSNCSKIGGCGAGSPQEQWLRADLASHPTSCALAYWHHPRFSSGTHGDNVSMAPIWQALQDAGAELVLAGHDHNYERFARQTASGEADPLRGIRQFIVGTGGKNHYGLSTIKANSEVRNQDTYGVLALTLHPNSYDWQFKPESGRSFVDSGSEACR